MPKSPPDPKLETVTDLVIEFRIERVPNDAMERSDLTVSMKAEIDALKAIVVGRHHGSAKLMFRDRRVEKPASSARSAPQGIDPATGKPTAGATSALSEAVAVELAEKDHPAGRRHGLHLSEPAAAE